MKALWRGLFVLVLLFSALPARAEQLLPADEGPRDSSFAAFRKQLLAAVERKDFDFVLGVIR